MLKVNNLNVYYGVSHALKDLNIEVYPGEIVTLIGANGAGKSTLMKTLSGLILPKDGTIQFEDKDITNSKSDERVSNGIACVPEGRRIFKDMSVKENILLGAYSVKDPKKIEARYKEMLRRFPILKDRKDQMAGNLSGGEQQMLAIARALMSKPKMLLLDEPSMGLAPKMIANIFSLIKEINEDGTTILLVEQNAKMALSISNRAYILDTGNIVLEEDSQSLMDSEEVRKIYLGG